MTTSTAARTTNLITGVDIFAAFTSDPQTSIAFYRDVLGITPTAIDDKARGAEFTLSDGSTFGVWQPEQPATGACVMFAVRDIHSAVQLLRQNGAQLSEPEETPACFMAFCKDPDGNTVIIHQRKD